MNIKNGDIKDYIEPGKKLKLEVYNTNLENENSKIYLNDNNQYIQVKNLEYPKIVKDKEEIYCLFDGKMKNEIDNIKE